MNDPLFILALTFFIISLIAFILISRKDYATNSGNKYDMRNMFPYELYEYRKSGSPYSLISRIALFSLSLAEALPLLFLFPTTVSDPASLSYFFLMIITNAIAIICFVILALVPIRHLKLHLYTSTLYFISTIVSTGMFAIFYITNFIGVAQDFEIVLGSIAAILCFASIAVSINPKLSKWAQLEKEIKEDNTATYKRPKHFALAYSEWLIFLINAIYAILIIVSLIY